ncbi:hydroxyacylglutathione hydrolase [Marinimicrobium sp. C6131]|uniref:hydroxyacylglutathione hydrolase n=1 Tax=Marinimicrobium sp. C6131 TaxID=3022676 RepID=UPI00223DF7BE|nr:hydroxyacylglutathione hydrolase [Marinimicrobium sp. C6131]UZJ45476.1 hydroxyacylglutathione hydrolase [Marinimicrobium sp. C6131]
MREPIGIPALDSNYFWLLPVGDAPECQAGDVYLVDPGDAGPVLRTLQRENLTLRGILITHHHWDHTDGLDGVLARLSVPVYGPDSVPQVDHVVKDGDRLELPGLAVSVMAVPGHTLDHLAYFQPAANDAPPRLFCGDALFAAGCGRLFEGTPAQAQASLDKLSALPDQTRIYCAHEYTQTNLRFALSVEPDNLAVRQRLGDVDKLRARKLPTLPSELALERTTNPYLRTEDPALLNALQLPLDTERSEVFAELRARKDRFL